jgi:NodT family efflux transporter outer membrane factor (OMF) lipoprotein
MNYRIIIFATAVSLMLTGCGIYDKYESKATVPADVFGSDVRTSDTAPAQMSWREFFTDPLLQQLIEQVLASNTDLKSARIAVEKSEAALKAAKLAYLPSLYFSPQGTIASFDRSAATKAYDLPLQMSMDLDVFGSITSQKRKSQAALMQAKISEEAVHANLISAVAQQYFLLQVLDLQLEILTSTDSLWNTSLETQKALWENGKAYSTAVNQMESSYLNVKTQIVDVRRNITSVENALCRLIAITPQHIERNKWGGYSLPHNPFPSGISSGMLLYRPDIRIADYTMAEAFYNTKAAQQAFFPSITLSGSAGWTNSAGGAIINPGKLLLSAVASLSQPIFARGRLTANKKIAQLTEKDMQQKYVQTVINAGNEVNEALADIQAARDKHDYYHRQVAVLHEAYTGTHELMDNGKASYLEVLTAQESLLSAQLSEAMNMYTASQAVIELYIALGGATN